MVSPSEVGMSRLERLTQFFKADTDAKRLPGAVVMIARHGKVVYSEAFGIRDPATGAPNAEGQHLSHLFDDQADYGCGGADAYGRGQAPSQRSNFEIPARAQESKSYGGDCGRSGPPDHVNGPS